MGGSGAFGRAVEVRVCGGLFCKAANLVQAAEGKQFALVLVVVGHGFARGLDVEARSRHGDALRA